MKKLITLLFVCLLQTSFATTYYVSNSGSDANTGTSISTAWQTISKVNATTFSPGDSILFKRGDIFYGSIIVSNSGSAGNPITFGAYSTGEKPIITGLTDVISWDDLGMNIWQSTGAISTLGYTNVVLVNHINTPMGRYPNTGYLTYQNAVGTTSITSSSLNSTTTDWTGAEAVIRKKRWIIDRDSITAHAGGTLSYTEGNSIATKNSNYVPGSAEYGFFIQNDSRTLDVADEWYYNASTKRISIYSINEPTDVKISTIKNVVSIKYVSNITLNNLSIAGANENAIYIGSGTADNIIIQNCDISHCYNGLFGGDLGGTAYNLTINNSSFTNINNNGIVINPEFKYATITNNSFKNIGLIAGSSGSGDGMASATALQGLGSIVQYNTVDSIGYNGLGIGLDSSNVSYNTVSNYCIVKDDGGGIYIGGNRLGVIISFNTILNGIGNKDGLPGVYSKSEAQGIYIDGTQSSGVSILNNTIANIGFAGIFLHNSHNIIVRGNTVYNTLHNSIGLFNDYAPSTITGLIIKNNIFVLRVASFDGNPTYCLRATTQHNDISTFGSIDSNYYARPIDDNLTLSSEVNGTSTSRSLAQWQTYSGLDAHSHKSPKAITSLDSLIFVYNNTNADSTILLPYNYIDMASNSYDGSITLQPWSSAVLIQDGPATDCCAGIEENENTTPISIFPNPVNDNFTVEGATQISSIKVVDLSGRTMKRFEPNSSNVYSVSGLASGTYLVVITDGSLEVSKHIVKQ